MRNKIAELLRQLTDRSDNRPDELLRCSFCHKSQRQVAKLIAGPKVFICEECVDICNHILHEDGVVVGRAELEIRSLLEEAKTNIEAAGVLVTAGKHRPAAQLAREATLALLHALLQRSHWYVEPGDVEEILRGAYLSDEELGAELEQTAERRLLERYFPQGVPVTREEAEKALAASRSLQELVERKLAEKDDRAARRDEAKKTEGK